MGKEMNKILVVDEDIQVRESVSLSLETAGYTVMVAGTCQEGLQHYERFLASLIIMDVVALEDGEDEPMLQVHHQFASIPTITLTGNISSSGGTVSALHHIVRPICTLQKPFTVDELLHTVQKVLAY